MGYYTKYKREKDLKAFSTNPLRTLSSDTFSHREEKKIRSLHYKCHWKSTNCQLTNYPASTQAVIPVIALCRLKVLEVEENHSLRVV